MLKIRRLRLEAKASKEAFFKTHFSSVLLR